jgi:hypothetical protein
MNLFLSELNSKISEMNGFLLRGKLVLLNILQGLRFISKYNIFVPTSTHQ